MKCENAPKYPSKLHIHTQNIPIFTHFSIHFPRNRLANCQKELNDEREMIKALRSNQSDWETKCEQLEQKFQKYQSDKEVEIANLKDEIRDLMFYMEAQSAVANSNLKDEIKDATIKIVDAPASSATPASGSSKQRGRGKKK